MDLIDLVVNYAVPFLIILSVVVFVHEFGHYWVARRNGVRVEIFSIGFGPELFGCNDRHGTRWKFSAIPLGGYVKMLGDADATSALPDARTAWQDGQLPGQEGVAADGDRRRRPGRQLPLRDRGAGLLFVVSGRPFTPAVVGEVQPGSPAAAGGLEPGDRIAAVDGQRDRQLRGRCRTRSATRREVPLELTVDRDGADVRA